MDEKKLEEIIASVVHRCLSDSKESIQPKGYDIPVGVSGRHVHLSRQYVDILFGKGHELVRKRDLSQPGQFVCEERVTIIGPKHVFQNVAVLGPVREHAQVEVSYSDARMLGVEAPVALSGHLEDASDIMVASNDACIKLSKSLIIAKNHVHMSEAAAKAAGVKDGDLVDVIMQTQRPITFRDVPVRAGEGHELEMHIDFDEMNACLYKNNDRAILIPKGGKPGNKEERPSGIKPPLKTQSDELQQKRLSKHFITEDLMQELFNEDVREVLVDKGSIVSSLARDFARCHSMKIQLLN